MTRKDVENWNFLELRAEQLRDQLRELESRALPKSPDWSDRARSSSPDILLDRLVPEIVDKRDVLLARIREVESEIDRIEKFVEQIEDPQIRVIVFYRCRQRMKWNEIAERIGGKNTEDSCKKIYYRFFDSLL